MVDQRLSAPFSHADVDLQQQTTVYRGFFHMEKVRVRHRLFAGGWSRSFDRELFVRPPAVAAVMYDPVNQFIGLVEQFRVGALNDKNGPWLCEVVAGMQEQGETKEQVIHRELQEEAGFLPKMLVPICDYHSSPGGTDETIALFCALGDLSNIQGVYGLPEENEDIRVVVLNEATVFDELYLGRFNNAATLICLQWLMCYRQQMVERYGD